MMGNAASQSQVSKDSGQMSSFQSPAAPATLVPMVVAASSVQALTFKSGQLLYCSLQQSSVLEKSTHEQGQT